MTFPRAFRHLAPDPDAPAARAVARTAAVSADRSLRAMLRELAGEPATDAGGRRRPVPPALGDGVVVDLATLRTVDVRDAAPTPVPAARRARRPLI